MVSALKSTRLTKQFPDNQQFLCIAGLSHLNHCADCAIQSSSAVVSRQESADINSGYPGKQRQVSYRVTKLSIG